MKSLILLASLVALPALAAVDVDVDAEVDADTEAASEEVGDPQEDAVIEVATGEDPAARSGLVSADVRVLEQRPARLVRRIAPTYPAFAIEQRIEGTCKVQADLDAFGKPTRVYIERCAKVFQGAAVEAVQQWRWQPAMLDGERVGTSVQVEIAFELGG